MERTRAKQMGVLPAAGAAGVAGGATAADWWEAGKPRLSMMSMATAVLGYLAAAPNPELVVFVYLSAGCLAAALGAGVLNQWWEREADGRMRRTAERPMAAGRMGAGAGMLYGLGLSVGGVGLLWVGTGALPALLCLVTVAVYLLVYTPLKRVTPWATEVGTVPGALPPLIGWTAAGSGLGTTGWILFGVLVAWQMPHFMAIARLFRDDYARGGFAMLSVQDTGGRWVAGKALCWTVVLAVLAILPIREAGLDWVLGGFAVLLSALMLVPAVRFWRRPKEEAAARALFRASLVFLPVYLAALVVDRFVW